MRSSEVWSSVGPMTWLHLTKRLGVSDLYAFRLRATRESDSLYELLSCLVDMHLSASFVSVCVMFCASSILSSVSASGVTCISCL